MTALDRTLIKALDRSKSGQGDAVAKQPAAAAPGTRLRVAATPPVPLSRALADLATTTLPSPASRVREDERGAGGEGGSPATAAESTTAPVSTSIAALLNNAASQGPGETSQGPDETAWRPLLQVDRVVWPSIHARLQSTAPAAVGQMTDGLLSICASGGKVLGLASCAGGEGVTTLLLAAAAAIAGQGRKVVVVDANGCNPRLAQSLGLLPQIGWEETLCGGLPLEEVVIESLADNLAVLPVRGPSANTIAPGQIAASFDILAREFDVVLVDLGPLDQLDEEGNFCRDAAARMDAVVLVQNVRVTTPNRLAEVRQRLAASNLRFAGTIQNFVAG